MDFPVTVQGEKMNELTSVTWPRPQRHSDHRWFVSPGLSSPLTFSLFLRDMWDFDGPLRSACYLSMSDSCPSVAVKLQQQTFTVFLKSRKHMCRFQESHLPFAQVKGLLSVLALWLCFVSAVVTLCVLTVFAVELWGERWFLHSPEGSRWGHWFKKKKKKEEVVVVQVPGRPPHPWDVLQERCCNSGSGFRFAHFRTNTWPCSASLLFTINYHLNYDFMRNEYFTVQMCWFSIGLSSLVYHQ